jgi:hypothetical protein
MNKIILTCVSMVVAGCGGAVDQTSPGNGGGSTQSPVPSPQSTSLGAPAVLPVSISGFAHASDGSALAGVEVCLQAGPTVAMNIGTCATSSADGAWTVSDVPANEDVTLALEKQGFAPVLRAVQTLTDDIAIPSEENVLMPAADGRSFMGTPTDTKSGQIAFFSTGQDDVSVKLFGFDRESAEPIYLDRDGKPAGANVTTGSRGGFVDLPTGVYMLQFSRPSARCMADTKGLHGYPAITFPDSTLPTIIVPVVEGYVTGPVGAGCSTTL